MNKFNPNEARITANPVGLFKGKRDLFAKRFTVSDPKTPVAQLCKYLATIVAEDVNTAYYVKEYGFSGNEGCRPDYIAYLANRLEFEMKKAGAGVK